MSFFISTPRAGCRLNPPLGFLWASLRSFLVNVRRLRGCRTRGAYRKRKQFFSGNGRGGPVRRAGGRVRETVMEVIERKDSSQRENNVTRHFSPRAQRGWANLLVLAGGSGRKQVTRVCQGSFVNPWATKEENLKSERVRYLAARIMWTATTSPDKVFSRAGRVAAANSTS